MNEFYIPQCKDPQILVNQTALRLIYDGAELNNFGVRSRLGPAINELPVGRFLRHAYAIYKKEGAAALAGAYVMDGEKKVYFYQMVECGHCVLCNHRKQIDLVNRATLEQLCYTCPPYFITLTYAPWALPPSKELRYTDVQRFFKRLRRSWDRKGISHSVRYIVCGEYGKQGNRPHYHVLLFNNPYNCDSTSSKHFLLYRDIYDAWSFYNPKTKERRHMSVPEAFQCEECNGGAAAYVTKYMAKDRGKFCRYMAKPFVKTSIKNGGIGRPYLAKILGWHRQNLAANKISFVSNADGRFHEITIGRYANRYLFPSPSALVPAQIKENFRQLSSCMAVLVRNSALRYESALSAIKLVQPPYTRIKFSRSFVRQAPVLQNEACNSPLYTRYICRKVLKVAQELYDWLVDHPAFIDMDVVQLVDKHRELMPPQIDISRSLGLKYQKCYQEIALVDDKSIL